MFASIMREKSLSPPTISIRFTEIL